MFTLAWYEIALTGLELIIIVTQGGALIRHSEAAPNQRSFLGFYKAHFQCSAQDTTHFSSRFLDRVQIENVCSPEKLGLPIRSHPRLVRSYFFHIKIPNSGRP